MKKNYLLDNVWRLFFVIYVNKLVLDFWGEEQEEVSMQPLNEVGLTTISPGDLYKEQNMNAKIENLPDFYSAHPKFKGKFPYDYYDNYYEEKFSNYSFLDPIMMMVMMMILINLW